MKVDNVYLACFRAQQHTGPMPDFNYSFPWLIRRAVWKIFPWHLLRMLQAIRRFKTVNCTEPLPVYHSLAALFTSFGYIPDLNQFVSLFHFFLWLLFFSTLSLTRVRPVRVFSHRILWNKSYLRVKNGTLVCSLQCFNQVSMIWFVFEGKDTNTSN